MGWGGKRWDVRFRYTRDVAPHRGYGEEKGPTAVHAVLTAYCRVQNVSINLIE